MTTNKLDKMRDDFDTWIEQQGMVTMKDGETYYHHATHAAWQAWKASRAALAIEVPPLPQEVVQGEPMAWVTVDTVDGQAVNGKPRRIWWENNEGVGMPIYATPQPSSTTQVEPVAWLPYLVDRADGVTGHYAIARKNPAGYREVWNLRSHRWAAFSDEVLTLDEALAILKKLEMPTAPKPSSKLPDFATDPDDSDEGASLWDHGFKRGWNACLEAATKTMQPAEQKPSAGDSLASVPDEVFAAEFAAWWDEHGQFCRSGGGTYERSFAFEAWRHLYPQLMKLQMAAEEQQPTIPNEHGKNRYGLDMSYFRNLFNRELNRPLVDFKPSELARVLARASRTADPKVMHETEFRIAEQKPAPDVSALVGSLVLIAETCDVGRHDGLPEEGPALCATESWLIAKDALAAHRNGNAAERE